MSRLDKRSSDRMRAAFEVEITDRVKQEHGRAIARALVAAPLDAPQPHASPQLWASWWRRRITALVAAAAVVLPVGTAVAAENTVPGDWLYPVKRVVEPIRAIVDSDVVARHRVDELNRLIDRPAATDRLPDALVDAEEAVTDLPADHPLRDELTVLTDRVTDIAPSDVPAADEPATDDPVTDQSVTDRQVTDDPVTGESTEHATTTVVSGDGAANDSPTDVAPTNPPADHDTGSTPPVTDAPITDG